MSLFPAKLFSFFLLLLFSAAAYSQTVSGTVTDANSQPIPGATVQVKNTTRATVTNEAGRFQINASGSDILVFSSVDYTPQEVPVKWEKRY